MKIFKELKTCLKTIIIHQLKNKIMIKKIILALLVLCSLQTSAQITRGRVLTWSSCQFNGSSEGYRVLKTKPLFNTYIRITRDYLRITGGVNVYYSLSDKQVDRDGVVSFYGKSRHKLYTIGIRDCNDGVMVAIFPMDGNTRFIQYYFKYIKN